MNLRLIRPSVEFRDDYLRALAAFQSDGLPWHIEVDPNEVARDFAGFVKRELEREAHGRPGCPETLFWCICRDEAGLDHIAGVIGVRHFLTEELRREGGHIGYDTVPGFRGNGVATWMLGQALIFAKVQGMDRVLITCNDHNIASARVIEKNGGVLKKKEILSSDRPMKRYYWVEL